MLKKRFLCRSSIYTWYSHSGAQIKDFLPKQNKTIQPIPPVSRSLPPYPYPHEGVFGTHHTTAPNHFISLSKSLGRGSSASPPTEKTWSTQVEQVSTWVNYTAAAAAAMYLLTSSLWPSATTSSVAPCRKRGVLITFKASSVT